MDSQKARAIDRGSTPMAVANSQTGKYSSL
jgi:hypothetical protein